MYRPTKEEIEKMCVENIHVKFADGTGVSLYNGKYEASNGDGKTCFTTFHNGTRSDYVFVDSNCHSIVVEESYTEE